MKEWLPKKQAKGVFMSVPAPSAAPTLSIEGASIAARILQSNLPFPRELAPLIALYAQSNLVTRNFTEQDVKAHGFILNPGSFNSGCNYRHATCVDLTAISVTGDERAMTKGNLTRILQTANELFFRLRVLAHINAKPNDDHLRPAEEERVATDRQAYDNAARETGLKATAVPSLEFLRLTEMAADASAAGGKK